MPLLTSPRLRLQAIAIAISTAIVALLALFWPWLGQAEFKAQDSLMTWTTHRTDPDLVLLKIDEASLDLSSVAPEEVAQSRALQLIQQGFPWSREVYGLAAQKILDAGAKIVIFDLTFPGPRDGDAAFIQVLQANAGHIVVASSFDVSSSVQQQINYMSYRAPTPEIAAVQGNNVGYANLPFNPGDPVVRWFYPYATANVLFKGSDNFGTDAPMPALTTAAARLLGYAPPLPPQPELLRFPYLVAGSIQQCSLYEIFVPALWQSNLHDGAKFKDKIVLIGSTSATMQDIHPTPFGQMPGPEIQLNILSAMKQGRWLHAASRIWIFLSVPLMGLLIFGLSMWKRRVTDFLWAWIIMALAWIGLFWAAYVFTGWFLPIAHPLATLFLCGFAAMASDVSLERRERGRLRNTLERYVSKDVVREIVDNPASYLQTLGGQRKEIIALFCDLKGFTSDAEHLDPTELVALLNEYFTEMVEVVFSHKGTLDKFMGDALMSTWGCLGSSSLEEDARSAVTASFEMKDRLAALNARREKIGIKSWHCGIGLTRGPAVFGNIGSQQKMDPTVIGDTVNLASRIEGLTRIYGCDVLMDERVAAEVMDLCDPVLVDIVRVKGRRGHETLFYPRRKETDAAWVQTFYAARKRYVEGDFAGARDDFARIAAEMPFPKLAECYRNRCEVFLRDGAPAEWDGIWSFFEK